jgi:2-dehydropantoate 2-reductase
MRIAILGAGAVGGYFGGMLARAEDVVFIARGRQLEALRSRGLTIRRPEGASTIPVRASDGPVDADVLIVCVKTYDTETACAPWKGTRATVVTLQNGLGNRERLAPYFSSIVEGIAYVAAEGVEPGVIQWSAAGHTVIGPSPVSADLKFRFDRNGAPCEIAGNIEQAIWEKLVANAVMNVGATVERCPLGELLREPRRETCERAIDELTAVAAAHGIVVRPDARERAWKFCVDHPDFPSSTQQDLAKGKPLETEALCGELVKRARKVGMSVPTLESFFRKMKELSPARPT